MTIQHLTTERSGDETRDLLFKQMTLRRGPTIPNRLALAPLTNTQSHADGTLSEDEYRWLTMRAEGGFGLVTTCASHVQPNGKGFPGQLGCFDDIHLPGLEKLASGLRKAGAISALQLHHAGIRAMAKGTDIVGPSLHPETGARALAEDEIEVLINSFVQAALRAQHAGFDGVQIHGGHGYAITQFLSPEINQRTDRWGGVFENRARLLLTILGRLREACHRDFQIGIRISPERFGLRLSEMIDLAQLLLRDDRLDYLDLSLWDVAKEPEDEQYRGRTLMSLFTSLERNDTRLGVAGKIGSPRDAAECLVNGADYVAIGRAGILAHDFPKKAAALPDYEPPSLPVSERHLIREGLGEAFVAYMRTFGGFVDRPS